MAKFDKIYKDIVETIDKYGIWSEGNVRTKYADGTPAHYKSYIGYQFRLDNSTDEAHLITTRFAPNKAPIRELYWIWIMQSNNVEELNKLKCGYWDEWAIKERDNRLITIDVSTSIKEKYKKLKQIKVNEIIDKNMPKRKTKKHGEYYVLGKEIKNGKELYKVQFVNTGSIDYFPKSSIDHNSIRDKYSRTESGVGYYGNHKSKEIVEYFGNNLTKWINKWRDLFKRCGKSSNYKNIFVDEYFHSCENFLKWVMENNRYGKEMLNVLQIDKDYYASNHYGSNTCVLLTPEENVSLTSNAWYLINGNIFFSKQTLSIYLRDKLKIKGLFYNDKENITNRKIVNKMINTLYINGTLKSINPNLIIDNKALRFPLEPKRTIGKAYGYQIAKQTFGYKSQLDYIINEIKKNPNSRRIMTEIWVPEDLDKMALTPCVHLTQWSVIGNKLYLEVRQRSCDVALGLVANVFQYSVLHKLVAMECGLEPADIIWNIHNVHIYDRHMPVLLEQIKREEFEGATLKIENFTSIYDFKPDDVVVENYKYGDKISYEVAI